MVFHSANLFDLYKSPNSSIIDHIEAQVKLFSFCRPALIRGRGAQQVIADCGLKNGKGRQQGPVVFSV